jgi:hypothetical protein
MGKVTKFAVAAALAALGSTSAYAGGVSTIWGNNYGSSDAGVGLKRKPA